RRGNRAALRPPKSGRQTRDRRDSWTSPAGSTRRLMLNRSPRCRRALHPQAAFLDSAPARAGWRRAPPPYRPARRRSTVARPPAPRRPMSRRTPSRVPSLATTARPAPRSRVPTSRRWPARRRRFAAAERCAARHVDKRDAAPGGLRGPARSQTVLAAVRAAARSPSAGTTANRDSRPRLASPPSGSRGPTPARASGSRSRRAGRIRRRGPRRGSAASRAPNSPRRRTRRRRLPPTRRSTSFAKSEACGISAPLFPTAATVAARSCEGLGGVTDVSRVASGKPDFEHQHRQRSDDRPTPDFLTAFQFNVALLTHERRALGARSSLVQTDPQLFQLLQFQRGRVAFGAGDVDREAEFLVAEPHSIQARQIGAVERFGAGGQRDAGSIGLFDRDCDRA